MEYVDVATARNLPGLRLVLTRGVPGPWSEAAKAVFHYKNIEFTPVAQIGGQENPELVEWTRHRNAPVAVYEDEPPRASWLEILYLAERLEPKAPLLPADIEARIRMIGLLNEVAGQQGMAWHGRLLMLDAVAANAPDNGADNPMIRDYGYSREAAARAPERIDAIVRVLADQLHDQIDAGSHYFIGDALTALDIYWAYFSQLLRPLPPEQNPMPNFLRKSWSLMADAMLRPPDPILFQHRDYVFEHYLRLPLEF